jgi:hypothetical protein
VHLSAKHRSLFVSTEEVLLNQQSFQKTIETNTNEHTTKFNCSELFQEGQWLHIVLIWSRAVLKNSQCTLYVNSNHIGTHKLHYINSSMQSNQAPSSMSIHACIGTLPMFRAQSQVVWRQASCYFFEESCTQAQVSALFQMGPNYLGSFQSPSDLGDQTGGGGAGNSGGGIAANGSMGAQQSGMNVTGASHISEEKIIFG